MSALDSPEEPWADHMGPLRTLGRVAFGAAIRFLLGALAFGGVCWLAVLIVWETLFGPDYGPYAWTARRYDDAWLEELTLAALMALAFGALRAIEEVGRVVEPEASYPRKLAMGAVVAVSSVGVVYALLTQLQYVQGMIHGGTPAAGFEGIASSKGVIGTRDESELLGIALAFGITGFGRARRLPLWEQVALVAPFGLLYVSEKLVYHGTFVAAGSPSYHAYELALWISAWVSALLLPVLARAGDAVERRFLPARLASRATVA